MPLTVVKSRDLKHSVSRTKKAAANAPVFITEYGKPAFVMLNILAYRQLIDRAGLPAAVDDLDPKFSYLFEQPRASSGSE